jgi:hypothetical protein
MRVPSLKSCVFFEYPRTYFQDHKLGVSSTSQVGESAMLLSEVDVRVASSVATFIPGFIAICKVVQKFKWEERDSVVIS